MLAAELPFSFWVLLAMLINSFLLEQTDTVVFVRASEVLSILTHNHLLDVRLFVFGDLQWLGKFFVFTSFRVNDLDLTICLSNEKLISLRSELEAREDFVPRLFFIFLLLSCTIFTFFASFTTFILGWSSFNFLLASFFRILLILVKFLILCHIIIDENEAFSTCYGQQAFVRMHCNSRD